MTLSINSLSLKEIKTTELLVQIAFYDCYKISIKMNRTILFLSCNGANCSKQLLNVAISIMQHTRLKLPELFFFIREAFLCPRWKSAFAVQTLRNHDSLAIKRWTEVHWILFWDFNYEGFFFLCSFQDYDTRNRHNPSRHKNASHIVEWKFKDTTRTFIFFHA